jgi:hypothetical protein
MKKVGLHHISEEEKLKVALERTPEERLYLLIRLIRLQKVFKKAIITHHNSRP